MPVTKTNRRYEGTLVSLRSREGLALLLALAIVLAIVFLSFRSWRASARHAEQVEVTRSTVSGIHALLRPGPAPTKPSASRT